MTHPSQRKGDAAERELQALLGDHLGLVVPRLRLAGKEDLGDLLLPGCAVQSKNYADIARALNDGLRDVAEQRRRAGVPFGVAAIRRRGGRWVFAMDPEQWCGLYREAMA